MSTKVVATRRRFFGHAGAALSAPLAVATTLAAAGGEAHPDDLTARVAALEDANAIRDLQQTYVRLVNAGAHADVAKLFADSAKARVAADVRRIVVDRFGEHDAVAIAPEGGTATARLQCVVETATAIEPSCTLVDMARLQGDGVVKRSARRWLETSYVKRGGVWQLTRADYRDVSV